MKFVELKKRLAENGPAPCYIITGDDAFVVKSAIGHFVALVGEYRELNYATFPKDAKPADVIAALSAPPLLAKYRVVAVNNFTADVTPFLNYLSSPVGGSVLLFVGPLTPNLNALMKCAEIVDCNRLDPPFLTDWVRKKAARREITLTPSAAATLVDYCARDMNRISTELDKLCDYSGGQEVTEETVRLLVAPEPEFKIYELSDAIATGNGDRAVTLVRTLTAENATVVSLISMVFNYFRRLLFVSLNASSETLASDLGAKEYAIKVATRQAGMFSQRRLKAIVDRLSDLDRAVKSGEIGDKNALTEFVCETVTTPRR